MYVQNNRSQLRRFRKHFRERIIIIIIVYQHTLNLTKRNVAIDNV